MHSLGPLPQHRPREECGGYLTTQAAHLGPQGLTHNTKHSSLCHTRTLSHGHTASVFSALLSTGWPRRMARVGVLGLDAESAGQTGLSPVGKPSGPLTVLSSSVSGLGHSAFPSSLKTRQGKMEPRRHQHCSCWGCRSIPEMTNVHKKPSESPPTVKGTQRGSPEGTSVSGKTVPPWITLASTLPARVPVPQLTLLG